MVTGVLLAFNLPVTIPLWQAALGSAIAIVVVKQLFGGIGRNFANPAIVGRIVLFLSFSKTMTMRATAYTTGDPGVGTITASGTTVRLGTVGVDRSQLPFGTKMYIVSNDGLYTYGFSIAEDTGSAIRKNRIDLYYYTYEECIQFGVRDCTVYILD